jgi:osmotically-inducible protein OsmY
MEAYRTDRQLQQNVLSALDWDPSIDATDIGVTVDNGIVTLRGDVRTFAEKAAAERVTVGVYGVKAIANDVNVRVIHDGTRTDADIAAAAVNALRWSAMVPKDKVNVTVSNGLVTLKGEVEWNFQRDSAVRAVRDLLGVIGVSNLVTLRPQVKEADVQSKIEAALKRSAEIDARRIHVQTVDGKVTLSGNVRSATERREAGLAAWAAPGVREVENHVVVVP